MLLTYGYDLKDGDDFMTAPIQTTELMSRVMLPGAALVNHLPFCAVPNFITAYWCLTAIFSAAHSFLGSVSQLRTIDSKRQGVERQIKERALRVCKECHGLWRLRSYHSR
jgi:hypothetical protein